MSDMDTTNPHQLFAALGLLPTATEKEVKQAYRKLALLHHPDKDAQSVCDPEKMVVINVAYSQIMEEKLYQPPRSGTPSYEDEPWYEFTQPWRPTPEQFQQFNDECIAAYVERHDDDIQGFVPGFDELENRKKEWLRHRYRVWMNGGKKQPFEPYPSTSTPLTSPRTNTSGHQTVIESQNDHTRSVRRKRQQKHTRQDNNFLEYLNVILLVFVVVLITLALCLSIISPESIGVWFLCFMVMILCAPMGWTDSLTLSAD